MGDWSGFGELRLWVLTVLAVVGVGEMVGRDWYVRKIGGTMGDLGLGAWEDALGILKGGNWVGQVLDEGAGELGREVDGFLRGRCCL